MTDPHSILPFPVTDPEPPPPVTVSVDDGHCQRYAICAQEAPAVFELGADGRLHYQSRPGAAVSDRVRQAARCCPTQAITLAERRR